MFTFPAPETARPFWRDMPENEAEASLYLEVAKGQCLAYAPLPVESKPTFEPVTFPFNYEDTYHGTITLTRLGEVVTLTATVTDGTGSDDYIEIPESQIPDTFKPYTPAGGDYASYSGNPGVPGVAWYYESSDAGADHLSFYGGITAAPLTAVWLGGPAEPSGPIEIPANYFAAIIMQARNIFNAGKSPVQGGDFDGSGYGVTTYPLNWDVKQMLRPELGLGAVV